MAVRRSEAGGSTLPDVLRALAEARDGPFYNLFVTVTKGARSKSGARPPDIGFRIYRVADGGDACVVLHLSAPRLDDVEQTWTLSVQTDGRALVVSGEVSVENERGSQQLFETSRRTTDETQAASLIHEIAQEVCAYREGFWTEED